MIVHHIRFLPRGERVSFRPSALRIVPRISALNDALLVNPAAENSISMSEYDVRRCLVILKA